MSQIGTVPFVAPAASRSEVPQLTDMKQMSPMRIVAYGSEYSTIWREGMYDNES